VLGGLGGGGGKAAHAVVAAGGLGRVRGAVGLHALREVAHEGLLGRDQLTCRSQPCLDCVRCVRCVRWRVRCVRWRVRLRVCRAVHEGYPW
jgi:hypothetical protein